MVARLRRLIWLTAAATLGLLVGCVGGSVRHLIPRSSDYPFLAERSSLPHHVPQYVGGLSLRYAMVHDVLHERFPKHGTAHYRERNRLTQQKLAALGPDDPTAFPLADDLAAGLERLGRPDDAVKVMRDKLARQQARGLTGRDLYTSYANLGTFLIHANAPQALSGDPAARERFREGVGLVRKSVEVNPEAHFGRERWQVTIAEFLLAAMSDPNLLRTFDCLGNRLDLDIEQILNREVNWIGTGYGRATDAEFSLRQVYAVPGFFEPGTDPADPARWAELSPVRRHVTKVGAEQGWDAVPVPSHRLPVPFDEPVLGIIGMWRQGGGANPHFSLALGEVMLRVGQRHVAWAAFERASRLADRYWLDPAVREFLRGHCRKRQADIERTLAHSAPADARRPAWQNVSPPLSAAEVAVDLRPRFEAELAFGEGYQRAYQQYEEQRLAAGGPLDDPHLFDAFHAGREPIASPVGPEEWFVWVPRSRISDYAAGRRWAWGTFGAGVAAILAAGLMRCRAGRAAGESKTPSSSQSSEGTEPGVGLVNRD